MFSGSLETGRQPSLMAEYAEHLQNTSAEHRAQLELALADRIKADFITNMSHELRTPLNSVIGFSKLLRSHDKNRLNDGEIAMYADLICVAASRLLGFINDVLDISKIQSGTYQLSLDEVDIEEVLRSVLRPFEARARQARIAFVVEVAPHLSQIEADAGKFARALSNIIDNALKFTPAGGEVRVTAAATPDDGVAIHVRDTGIGMSPEEISLALAPFGQVKAGRARSSEGAGLGLPLAHALVRLHGGQLEIHSEKACGTQVSMQLPAARAAGMASADVPAPSPRAGAGA